MNGKVRALEDMAQQFKRIGEDLLSILQEDIGEEGQQGCSDNEGCIDDKVVRFQIMGCNPPASQRLADQHDAIHQDHFLK